MARGILLVPVGGGLFRVSQPPVPEVGYPFGRYVTVDSYPILRALAINLSARAFHETIGFGPALWSNLRRFEDFDSYRAHLAGRGLGRKQA